MRTKYAAKESSGFYAGDPILTPERPLGKHAELRKIDGQFISSRGKSKCASVRENSRSGGTTPRCTSESPSPKCEGPGKDLISETPRTYLIKDSFPEPECILAEQQILCQPSVGKVLANAAGTAGVGRSPKNVITCASPIATANKFLSEIEEVEWSYDGDRLVAGEATSCSNLRREEDDRILKKIDARELKKLKGKAQMVLLDRMEQSLEKHGVARDDKRGKAPMAFPTEEDEGRQLLSFPSEQDLPKFFTGGARCIFETPEAYELSTEIGGADDIDSRIPAEMPAWFGSAYRSLTQIDDQETDVLQETCHHSETSERFSLDTGASSSNIWQKKSESFRRSQSQESENLTVQASGDLPAVEHHEELSDGETVSLGDKVQSEIRKAIFREIDEQQQQPSKEVEEEETGHAQQGTGWLWKMSLCASVSFVTWVLVNGARIQCRSLFPTIREREQPLKIIRRRNRTKFYEAEET